MFYATLLDLVPGTAMQVAIVQHGETNSRGTGLHAAILAPTDTTLFRHASGTSHHRRQQTEILELPDFDSTTVVLFPECKVSANIELIMSHRKQWCAEKFL
jgi:hypothetical protein